MKYLIIFFFSIWGLFSKSPEPKILFKGTVKDKATKEALIACEVSVKNLTSGAIFKTLTDTKGNFELTLTPGKFKVNYSYIGYTTFAQSYNLNPKKDTIISKKVFLTEKKKIQNDSISVKTDEKKLKETDALEVIKFTPSRGGTFDYYAAPSLSYSGTISSSGSATSATMSYEDISTEGVSGDRVTYASRGIDGDIKAGTLTAGEINDFSKWSLWEDLSKGELNSFIRYWGILPKHRFSVLVTN